jgi:hypothetical protein
MPDYGAFSGEPKTIWLTEDGQDRYMKLIEPFWYKGKVMDVTVPANYRIDGASIPRALWTLVGSPYTGEYRRASIVHDKACDDANGDAKKRRIADRMFYYACRAGGCSWAQAVVLYIGVRIGAAQGQVGRWNQTESDIEVEPQLVRSQADLAIERDFSAAARIVLRQGEIDEAVESQGEIDEAVQIERRTDDALEVLTGITFREA